MIGQVIRSPHLGSRSGRRGRRRRTGPRRYRIAQFLSAYGIAILVNLVSILFVLPLIVLVYPITGIILSRYIGRRIVWWEYTANLQNISSVKLHFIVTWPVSMPSLIWQTFVVKFL